MLEKPVKLLLSAFLPYVETHLSLIFICTVKPGSQHTNIVYIDVTGHPSMEFDGFS